MVVASEQAINKRCLVFGGSGELGQAICRVLQREGAEIAFSYRSQQTQAQALAAELGQCRHFHCQLHHESELAAVLQQGLCDWDGIDAVIIATGRHDLDADVQSEEGRFPQLAQIDQARLTEVLQQNIANCLNACRAALPYLKGTKASNIVLLGSLSGVKLVPAPVHLAAAKSALIGITHALAKELGRDNICVNMVAPGIVESKAVAQLPTQIKHDYLTHCALGRFARVTEIAECIAWLALENSYINGQVLTLDGGL